MNEEELSAAISAHNKLVDMTWEAARKVRDLRLACDDYQNEEEKAHFVQRAEYAADLAHEAHFLAERTCMSEDSARKIKETFEQLKDGRACPISYLLGEL